ncbi:Crp/Fnr family transcriptional regulator [Loktanella sp. Alg231-35]|uniref:Crp/Fnr family transcriptional regulator n=1 Tax=Loktanella sp. Alg231-35 TaxID=1922220 RepID=UPI000D54F719|nr:cyclic nucleotide-binding domain-containing protein [Loktanella sp. Alg231-35]
MFEFDLSPSFLVACAGGVQIIGYLLINQTYLRLTMLCSTSLYIVYYFYAAETPLWGAIAISTLTLVAILIGLAALYARNASWSLPEEHKDIYPLFNELQPGDFSKVMRMAKRMKIDQERVVTREGEEIDALYYVTSGHFTVRKGAAQFEVPGPTFIGEVAYLMGQPSAATTTLPAGTEVLEWPRDALARQSRKNPRLKLALEALISRDLAVKVSLAVSPDAKPVAGE